MSRHYTARAFFRQMPNRLLARYFHERGLLTEFDFTEMKETKIEPLFEAWLAMPEEQRGVLDTDFREIFALSTEKGFKAIIDEAQWQLEDEPAALEAFVEQLSALPSHQERAMVTFLDHRGYWKGASHFHYADTLPYWRKRKHLGHNPAAVDEESIRLLAEQIGHYFHRTEGRGANCRVEPFRRGELDYFFAYPEDYSQETIEWVDGEFERRPHNPALEVIFVYSQKEGSLDLNFRGNYKAIEPLQGIFATTILKLDELPPEPKDNRVYDLNLLSKRNFEFSIEPGTIVQDIAVKKLRLSSRYRKGERVTLEANCHENPEAVYEVMEQIGRSLPLRQYHISQVEIAVTVQPDPEKRAKRVNIRLTHPNSCSLKYDEIDQSLRQMLSDSGIELKPPTEVQETIADTGT